MGSSGAAMSAGDAADLIKQRGCATCHGANGEGTATGPTLAGQHASYLERALLDYQLKNRANVIMQSQLGPLANDVPPLSKAQMRLISRHFSKLPGLVTPSLKQ